jgi:sugar phosphate isomerase/epimerase
MLLVHGKASILALGMEDGIAVAAEAGFDGVVLWPGDDGETLADGLRIARRLGVRLAWVGLPKRSLEELAPGGRLDAWIHRVHDEGLRASLIFSDRVDGSAERAAIADRAAELLDRHRDDVLLENCGGRAEVFSDLELIAALAERVPGLRVAFDLGHAASSGAPVDRLPASFWRRVACVDAHDNDGERDLHLPLGAGERGGSFERTLSRLPCLPAELVVETDHRAGSDRARWRRGFERDRALLLDAVERWRVERQRAHG